MASHIVTLTDDQAVALELLLSTVLADTPEHPHASLLAAVVEQLPVTAPMPTVG